MEKAMYQGMRIYKKEGFHCLLSRRRNGIARLLRAETRRPSILGLAVFFGFSQYILLPFIFSKHSIILNDSSLDIHISLVRINTILRWLFERAYFAIDGIKIIFRIRAE